AEVSPTVRLSVRAAIHAGVLRAAEVVLCAGIDGAAIELGHGVVVVERRPDHFGISAEFGLASGAESGGHVGGGIVGAEDSTIGQLPGDLVGGAIIAGMKNDGVAVGMAVLSGAEAELRSDAPGDAAVIGAGEVDAADPDAIGVDGIDDDHFAPRTGCIGNG